jgi:hypothetical protein
MGGRRVRITGLLGALLTAVSVGVPAAASAAAPPPVNHSDPFLRAAATPAARAARARQAVAAAGAKPSGPWTPLTNQLSSITNEGGYGPGTMLLENDGTVLVHDEGLGGSGIWWRLTPDAKGSYVYGTWSQLPPMPSGYQPLYFGSAILPTGAGQPAGSLIVEGGEYNFQTPVWETAGAIYNPVTNSWQSVAPPAGWTYIGDAMSAVLPNGQFMLSSCCDSTNDMALLNPSTLTWTPTGAGKADNPDEEGWTMLPNGHLLDVDVSDQSPTTGGDSNVEFYNPSSGTWRSHGSTPTPLVDMAPYGGYPLYELGPAVYMPNSGNVLAIGGNGNTALYHYRQSNGGIDTGSWTTGPTIPNIAGQPAKVDDGSAAPLPDGNVLLEASTETYGNPTQFYLYNGSSVTPIANPPDAQNIPSYATRMLVLPNGQILYNDDAVMEVYTATGSAPASELPSISSVPTSLAAGSTYTVSGSQLSGLSQGAQYGDDAQQTTNFPLVRLTNTKSGDVVYAPTSGESTLSIAPGATSSAQFTVPSGTARGTYQLSVVGDGLASPPVGVTVH